MLISSVFGTRHDTQKMYVSKMKTSIVRRSHVDKSGLSRLYLHASNNGRERIPLDIYVTPNLWIPSDARVKEVDQNCKDINLIIENVEAKITNIKTIFRLNETELTLKKFKEEFLNGIPRMNFTAFADSQLQKDKAFLGPNTYRRIKYTLKKLKRFQDPIYFSELDEDFIKSYRKWMIKLGNNENTIVSNLRIVKKYCNQAVKAGIRFPLDIELIATPQIPSNRVHLSEKEVTQFFAHTMKEQNPSHKLIGLYFLFTSITGLRFDDTMSRNRNEMNKDTFTFTAMKTIKSNPQSRTVSITSGVRKLLNASDKLFVQKFGNEYFNRELKKMALKYKIDKHLTHHVARHTFATNFLRRGGSVQVLQRLMDHSKITTTMIYVHIIEGEANEQLQIMDGLFQ